jgi:predicted transcriptional regulator/CRISPR/Cas system-associated endoribonuclease Cas2
MKKRGKKFFDRTIILEKLLTAGEISTEILLGLTLDFFDFAKAMTFPPQEAQRALRKQKQIYVNVDLKSKVAFWKMLSKLRKENLIIKDGRGKITITKQGQKFLDRNTKKPSRHNKYKIEKNLNGEIILVVFDIPEKQRLKRDWLRFQLEQFNFKVLQKSVWWGTAGLPKKFIKDLKKYEILDYVHIFSVKKKGTISTVIDNTNEKSD